jgi:hypothetical protein
LTALGLADGAAAGTEMLGATVSAKAGRPDTDERVQSRRVRNTGWKSIRSPEVVIV